MSRRSLSTRPAVSAALATAATLLASPAWSATPQANLQVQLSGPSSVQISRPATYAMTVTNLGGQTSGTITARVKFPLTRTSPQVWILGTVGNSDNRCQIVSRELVCTLPALRRNWSTTVYYQYTAPVSTQPLQMTATVSSTVADPVAGNNTASVVPNLVYPARAITSAPVTVRMCTGTTLTAFEECTRFPSSIQGFTGTLQANGVLEIPDAPGYSGVWSQNAARTSLKIEMYVDSGSGPVKKSEFNGWAVNDRNCFEGMTVHLASTYVSPYQVCMP